MLHDRELSSIAYHTVPKQKTVSINDVAAQISRDRTKWIEKQVREILPNKLRCDVKNRKEGADEAAGEYLLQEGYYLENKPLETILYKEGVVVRKWIADVNIEKPKNVIIRPSIIAASVESREIESPRIIIAP